MRPQSGTTCTDVESTNVETTALVPAMAALIPATATLVPEMASPVPALEALVPEMTAQMQPI